VRRLVPHWRHWLLLATCLGALGALLAFNLQRQHDRIESAEIERLTKQTKVIEVNLTRQLAAINLALESIMAELPDWASRPDGQQAASRRLKSMEASMPSVRTFLVLDAQGTITRSSRDELMGRNFAQRAYFQAHLQPNSRRNTLHVSSPFKSVLDVYVINLTRAITGPRGEFAGVVSATVDPVDIQTLLNSVRYADDMRATLVHGDGKVFVSQPEGTDLQGKDLSGPGSFFSQHLKSQRAVSHFKGIVQLSGDQRMPVLRTVQPPDLHMDQPLVAGLSRAVDVLFAPWQRDVWGQLLAYALLVVLSCAGLHLYLRQRALQRATDQRLKLANEARGVGIWEYELSSRRYHWDAAMFDLFGLNPQQVNALNNDWRELLLPGELQRMKEATRATLKGGQAFHMTFQIRRPDGQVRFMQNRAALHCNDLGSPDRLIGTTEDVTERKLREVDLRVAATAFDCQESILITDPNKVILRVNRAFTGMFGYASEQALGQTPRLLQSRRHGQPFYAAMWECINRDGTWQGEIWNRRQNGEVFPNWLSISAVRDNEGAVTHYVGTHTDITERKAAEEEIRQLAFYDTLTGLPNRRLLQDRLGQTLSLCKRERTHLALMFLDLDKFKPVNDEFGHPAGDELLQAVAQRVQACVRESDTVARFGGDEFVVLLSSIESAQDAIGVAKKIHATLVQPFILSTGQRMQISSSTGISIYPEHGSDVIELTRHADAAMYQAKAAGRDRFVVFGTTTQSAGAQS